MTSTTVTAHLRIARPTDNLSALFSFYGDGLGFKKIGEFQNHQGFDGLMLGHDGAGYHLEFTTKLGHKAGRAPTEDNLLIFYLPDKVAFDEAVARMENTGHISVASFNPYWDQCGKTFEDPDGYRVVLANMRWPTK